MWGKLVAAVLLTVAAAPAVAAPMLQIQSKPAPAMVDRARATLSAALPAGGVVAPVGLQLTTAIGGPASRERIEGRLETRTQFASPQIGCWRSLTRRFFVGLELGWAVASSNPVRDVAPARGSGGFAALARPTVSVFHFGWRR